MDKIQIIVLIIILVLFYILYAYNKLITLKNRVKEAFSTMDVYLKKRWDLIPNLVEVTKGYASHEENVFTEITKIKNLQYNGMNNTEKIDMNLNLTDTLSRMMILVEQYPELKATENFQKLATELVNIEDEIENSRKYYNGCVRIYNTQVESFPSNIVSAIFGMKIEKMFEANSDERKNVNVELK